jgi:lipoprotein-anchoring transpeptidase ErfK/SrfK
MGTTARWEAIPPKKHNADGERVVTIVVDKATSDVRAYNEDGNLVAFYPATIGSEEKPAPTGKARGKAEWRWSMSPNQTNCAVGMTGSITAKGQARHSRTAASAMEPDRNSSMISRARAPKAATVGTLVTS